jgi:uncharacterized membrane protein YcaP (DUF421 family)
MVSWLAEVFAHPSSMSNPEYLHLLGGIALKTTVIYFFLVIGLRILGKRELGQMNIYDLVLVIVLANAVQNAMVGDDNTLLGGMTAATTLLVLNRLFTIAMLHSKRLEHVMVGEPVLILNDGKLVADRMRHEGVTEEQVLAALREHGLERLDQAHMCILEVDGTISVVSAEAEVHKTHRHYRALRLP